MQNYTMYIFYGTIIPLIIFNAIIYYSYRGSTVSENKKYSTFWPRVWGPSIDSLILFPISIIIFFIHSNIELAIISFTLLTFIENSITYFYTIYMHGKFGQTFGKMVCKVKVVDNLTEKPITFKKAILRDIIPVFILLITSISFFINSTSNQLNSYNSESIAKNDSTMVSSMLIGSIFLIWFLAEVVTMLTNKKRRALHDYIAGTVVVRTNINKEEIRIQQNRE